MNIMNESPNFAYRADVFIIADSQELYNAAKLTFIS